MRSITIDMLRKEFEGRGYTLLSNSYKNREKLIYLCPEHPEGTQSVRYDSFHAGSGCRLCANEKKRKPIEEVRFDVESRGYKFVGVTYTGRRTNIKYICSKHPSDIQEMLYENFYSGANCAICTGHKKKTYDEVKKYFEQEEYELVSTKYLGPHKCLKYICPNHKNKVQKMTWNNFYYNEQRCPICKETKGERAIRKFLEKENISFVEQKRFEDLKDIRKLSFDFYIPSLSILIEYQGEYHDGTIMKSNSYYQTAEDFESQQKRDSIKKQYAKENNYNLIEIWYWDYDRIDEILKQTIFEKAGGI